jgi:hypothetical protein
MKRLFRKPSVRSRIAASILTPLLFTPELNADELIESKVLVSDGSPYLIGAHEVSLTPPVGWQILPDYLGKSLVVQVPEFKPEDESKPKFQRNITVAVQHESSPIDDMRVEDLRKQLTDSFGKGRDSFALSPDHKFFDYKGKNDGIIIYSFFDSGEFPLTQMHVFVSGSEKSVLLTYTDLTEGFEERMTDAWNAMISVNVAGEAPKRFESLKEIGAGILAFFLTVLAFLGLRRIRFRSMLKEFETEDQSEQSWYADDGDGSGFARSSRRKAGKKRSRSLADRPSSAVRLVDSGHDGDDDWEFSSTGESMHL